MDVSPSADLDGSRVGTHFLEAGVARSSATVRDDSNEHRKANKESPSNGRDKKRWTIASDRNSAPPAHASDLLRKPDERQWNQQREAKDGECRDRWRRTLNCKDKKTNCDEQACDPRYDSPSGHGDSSLSQVRRFPRSQAPLGTALFRSSASIRTRPHRQSVMTSINPGEPA
jgi:hypothetical protein